MRMLLIIPQNFISNSLKLFKPVINQSSSRISYPVNIQLLVKQYSVLIGNKSVNHEKQNLNEVHEFYSTAFGVLCMRLGEKNMSLGCFYFLKTFDCALFPKHSNGDQA